MSELGLLVDYSVNKCNMVISDSLFENNYIGVRCPSSGLTIHNTVFTSNKNGGLEVSNTFPGTVLTYCNFHGNQGSAITLYSSILLYTVELRGETVFRDNTAERGGGLALYDSVIVFGSDSNTTFINNRAENFGGGIYIHASLSILIDSVYLFTIKIRNLATQKCFYKAEDDNNTIINFIDNGARLGGLDIFGATLYTTSCSLRRNIFNFSEKLTNQYQVSSDPLRVCFCVDNVPQCENIILNESRYPGETFTVSVVLTGYGLGRVAGSVYTNVLGKDYKQVISESQHVQTVELMGCTEVSYTVSDQGDGYSVKLILTAKEEDTTEQLDETYAQETIRKAKCLFNTIWGKLTVELQTEDGYPCVARLTTPVIINVTLEACPLGFEMNEENRVCDCDKHLKDIGLTCDIQNHTGYVNRKGTVWVGVDTGKNNTNIYYWHKYCPADYCIQNLTSIDIRSPDEQCSSNRSGLMCGRCQASYSLQLGGNKCNKCDSNYLTLLIVFAALGILLVALIKLLDLTVASGTVSGLIFYANVVWRNNAILFSLQDKQNIGYYVVTLPIAWINLDFGIEVCFSENLDQLTKTGLQFVFPVYIWCIAGIIIILSHYSIRATKLFGNNSVAVLATLFLLSYGKLFRTITDVFTFADLPDSNGTVHRVWFLNGNVGYGETPGHIVLIVLALFFVLFLLPFTVTLLLVPFLRVKSHAPSSSSLDQYSNAFL